MDKKPDTKTTQDESGKGIDSKESEHEKRKKKERKLDKTIEDTFPASDPTAKY